MDDEYVEHQANLVMAELSQDTPENGDSMLNNMDDEFEEGYIDNGFGRNGNRAVFRNGRMTSWMNGPIRLPFRGRGYAPVATPQMRGRGYYRTSTSSRTQRYGNGFDGNWVPMNSVQSGMMSIPMPYPPPPSMMAPGGSMGPAPPAMMGQGPVSPFGPPHALPPLLSENIWVETVSDNGKSYFYNAQTRETTWTKPQETGSIKIVSQVEYEIMATAMTSMNNSNGGQIVHNNNNNNIMPMGNNMMQPNSVPYNVNQSSWVTKQQDGTSIPQNYVKYSRHEDFFSMDQQVPPSVDMQNSPPLDEPAMQQFNSMPQFPVQPQNMAGANMGNWWGGHNQPNTAGNWTNALLQQQSPQYMPQQLSQPILQRPQPEPTPRIIEPPKPVPEKKPLIPPELEKAAEEWTTHKAPDGRPYYYHAGNKESVWIMPAPMKQLRALKHKLALQRGVNYEDDVMEVIELDDTDDVKDVAVDAEAAEKLKREEEEKARLEKEKADKSALEKENKENAEKEKAEKESAEKKNVKEKDKPCWTKPITGTRWCVVWTAKGEVFFHNASACISSWNRPKQLYGSKEVNRALLRPPQAVSEYFEQKKFENAKQNGDLKRSSEEAGNESDEPIKKQKVESVERQPELSREEAAEAEIRAATERANVPLETRIERFKQMLVEKDISAVSTWDKDLHKISYDDRFFQLNCKERKQVFEKFVRERAEEERKEKKNRILALKNAYRSLMEEAKIHSKSSYTDFAFRYCREERFRAVEKARDRESYFNEYIIESRKKEKEEREKKKESAKNEFIAMLKEKAVDRHLRWPEAKKKVDSDPRYKAVDSSSLKEEYYREYCRLMKEEKKKESKEKDRGTKKEKKDKEKKEKKKEKAETDTSTNDSTTEAETEMEDDEAEAKEAEQEIRIQATPANVEEKQTPKRGQTTQLGRVTRVYKRDKQSAIKKALGQLLKETKSLTHKSLATTRNNTHGFQLINDVLKRDPRYLALNHIPEERHQIILSYLEDLEKKGPPPPPTATEPTRRLKR